MYAFVTPCPGAEVEPAEVAVPTIDDDELLVQVRAVGVGIHDSYFLPAEPSYPYPIGIEAAGVVEQVGAGVAGYRRGDRITFVSAMQPKGGTWAQSVAVKADSLIVPVPAGLDFVVTAALPVAGNTALRAVDALAALPVGASLFIAGGSGAIGTLAIQLARQRGWRVAASASTDNHDYLRSLGAEATVDYRDPDWPAQVRRWMVDGVDAAMTVPPGTTAETLGVVRDGGHVITISGDAVAAPRGITVEVVSHQADVRDELAQLVTAVADGQVQVELERVYPFEQALAALAKVRTRHARGKIVLRLD